MAGDMFMTEPDRDPQPPPVVDPQLADRNHPRFDPRLGRILRPEEYPPRPDSPTVEELEAVETLTEEIPPAPPEKRGV
jgi:hypothetical protein